MLSYCIEFRLCGEDECGIICRRIGRSIITPLDLPILDRARRNEHFMMPEKIREYINKKNPSIDSLLP